ncbi:MAG: phosphofructokinase, partial [Armatimonadetes bacterium]|nr:phosphofructokinase [Armatimonadota bacterium]
MILTVTPNTGLDRVLFVPSLERNRRNQATDVVESMGGKGCDVSLILRELGVETVATGLAGGDTGRRMEQILRRADVIPDFVWTRGETRFNTVLIETETGHHTTLCAAGLKPDDEALSGLLAWIERWSGSAEAIVLAGSLPETWEPEVYGRMVRAASRSGKPVIVDASGPALLAAVDAGVTAAKPNVHELESVSG